MCTNEVRIDNIEIERVNLKSVELVSGGFGGSVTFLVAADDAVPKTKVKADFVCDGIEDHIEILEAIDKLPSPGGTIVLSEGSFNLSSKITFPDKGIRLVGQGLPGRDFDDNATILNFTFTEKGICFEFTP